jgi:hypothetical protein
MGIIGIIIAVTVMVFGAGYLLSGSSGSSLSVENPVASQQPTINSQQEETETRFSVGMAALEKAKETKDLVEQKAAETVEQGAGSKEQATINSHPASTPPSVESDSGRQKTENQDNEISVKDRLVSFGYTESSGRKIDTVVLHSSYNNQGGDRYSVEKVIDIWKSYEVAPHYMIDRKGNILRLVEDEDIAYHAGNSKMPDGRKNVNDFSLGVEILNAEDDQYTTAQYESVNELVAYLKKKHGVKYVVGHDDIAPSRKTDPWNFDWKKLK